MMAVSRYKTRYQNFRALGLCGTCGKNHSGSTCMCEECKKRNRGYYKRRKARCRKQKICINCKQEALDNNIFCESCKDHRSKYKKGMKDKVYEAYGGYVCKCCGETDKRFLSLDHVNNDGAEHKRAIGGNHKIYRWLIKHNFPPIVQVLCMNCNWSKRHGACPHVENTDKVIKAVSRIPMTY